MVATIVRILDDLLENLDRSWDIEQTAEHQRQTAYEENDEHVQRTKQSCVDSL
jgi:hypothetical protein